MPRYSGSGKATTADYHSVDVRRWRRDGLLEPSQRFNWRWSRDDEEVASITVQVEHGAVVLRYRTRGYGSEWQPVEDFISLDWTDCHLGGLRPWFSCPGCGSRRAILYLAGRARCRRCLDLAYESQREDAKSRAISIKQRRQSAYRLRNRVSSRGPTTSPHP